MSLESGISTLGMEIVTFERESVSGAIVFEGSDRRMVLEMSGENQTSYGNAKRTILLKIIIDGMSHLQDYTGGDTNTLVGPTTFDSE